MKKYLLFTAFITYLLLTLCPGYNQGQPVDSGQQDKAKSALGILPTGEFEINPEKIYLPANYEQFQPSVAFNGNIFLVVWEDGRGGIDEDIFGARLDASGNLIDEAGFVICNSIGDQRNPSVSTNGDEFMVVWEDERHAQSSGIDIYGARVSGEGALLDPSGIIISAEADDQTLPAIAAADNVFFALWVDRRSGTNNDIYGSFISSGGEVANPEGLPVCTQGGWQDTPAICFDGSRFFIVWSDQRGFSKDIYGTFLKNDGTFSHPGGTGIVTLFNNQEHPSIAWSGSQFFLAWEENQTGSTTKIKGGRLNSSGILVDVNGFEIASYTGFDFCNDPQVTAMDADFMVAFTKGMGDFTYTFSIIAKRISQNGTVLDPEGLTLSDNNVLLEPYPSIAFNGTNVLAAWGEINGPTRDIFGSRITSSGNILDPGGFVISMGYNAQRDVSMAFDGTNYLAAWSDTRNGNLEGIYVARINDQGTLMDPVAVEVASGVAQGGCFSPAVAFNGTNYLVAWQVNEDIYGSRINKQGNVLDAPFVISNAANLQGSPVIASDSVNWLVAWEDARSASKDIYGSVVASGGSVLQPLGIVISSAPEDQENPAIVFANGQYVIVWEDNRDGSPGLPDIYGARVSADGTVLDPNGIGMVLDNAVAMMEPSLAFDGTNFFVCWTSGDQGNRDINGLRFDASLSKLDAQPFPLTSSPRDQVSPDVAWNGEYYQAVWMDMTALMKTRISMAKILPDGSVAETGVISEHENNLLQPRIVHGPLKQMLVSYTAFMESIDDEPVNSLRALGFLIGQGQGPGIEEHDNGSIGDVKVFPNPASESLAIHFLLKEKAYVSITLVTRDGRVVRTLSSGDRSAGNQSLSWDVTGLQNGAYIVKIKAGSSVVTRKVLVFKNQ